MVDLDGGLLAPRLHRRPRPRRPGRPRADPLRPVGGPHPRGLPAAHLRLRRLPPRPAVDPRRRLVDGRLRERRRAGRRPRRRRARPARSTCSTATTTAPGSTASRCGWPGVTDSSPDPAHGHFERDEQGRPSGTLHEGAMDLVHRLICRRPPTRSTTAVCSRASSTCTPSGVTGWQDAIVGAYGGIDDPGPTYAAAARNGDLTAFVVGALWWERDQDESQIASLEGAPPRLLARPVLGHQRQDHAGRHPRERHGGDVDALPRPLRARHHQHRPLLRRPGRAAALPAAARGGRLPGPRARHRRPRRARGARRVRGRLGGRPRARCATTSRTCRSWPPTTYAASPSSA